MSFSVGKVAQCEYEVSKDQSYYVGTQAPPVVDEYRISGSSSSTALQVNDF